MTFSASDCETLFNVYGPRVDEIKRRCLLLVQKILEDSFCIESVEILKPSNKLLLKTRTQLDVSLSFEVFHSTKVLGFFRPPSIIGINLASFYWSEEKLKQILIHELIHLICYYRHGRPDGDRPHGKCFKMIAKQYSIPASIAQATTANEDLSSQSFADDRFEATVKKLLALSKSKVNKNEAQLALLKLEQLLRKRSASFPTESILTFENELKIFKTKKVQQWQRSFSKIVEHVLGVSCCVIKTSSKASPSLVVCGPKEKILKANYVVNQLLMFCDQEYLLHKKTLGRSSQKDSFYQGLYEGFIALKELESKKLEASERMLIKIEEDNKNLYSQNAGWITRTIRQQSIKINEDSKKMGTVSASKFVVKEGLDSPTNAQLLT